MSLYCVIVIKIFPKISQGGMLELQNVEIRTVCSAWSGSVQTEEWFLPKLLRDRQGLLYNSVLGRLVCKRMFDNEKKAVPLFQPPGVEAAHISQPHLSDTACFTKDARFRLGEVLVTLLHMRERTVSSDVCICLLQIHRLAFCYIWFPFSDMNNVQCMFECWRR